LDWLTVASLANRHFVAPALWTTLARPEFGDKIPDDVRSYLALLHAGNAERNARIRHQCLEIGATLAKAGLRAALLKGATWLFDGSTAPASDRMMRDIDLLVAPDDVEPAVQALTARGYRDTSESFVEIGHYHHAPLQPPNGEAMVEIHRDLAHRAELLRTQDVIASATEVAPGLLLPAPRHRIAHNVIHAQIENGDWVAGVFDLRDGLDLARLMARHGSELDWVSLAHETRNRGFLPILSGAVYAAHRVLQSPLPAAFVIGRRDRLHAWRCLQQRRWPLIGKVPESLGRMARALAWERDAYGLKLSTRRSLRAQLLVNAHRARRAKEAFKRLRFGRPWGRTD
jgi:hypothetical protein